ncbi:hypothetical protein J3Q64DRAFT_1845957 [Phycomyces blakesleeanus]|uniref:Homeodomain-like DNA binding domain-containing transcription factor n=1 Tax=Phycomyces blakesleeanus TaxID=4837 RepID=A0ABR3BAL5_PHYBL
MSERFDTSEATDTKDTIDSHGQGTTHKSNPTAFTSQIYPESSNPLRELRPKRPRLDVPSNTDIPAHIIDDLYVRLDKINGVLSKVLKNVSPKGAVPTVKLAAVPTVDNSVNPTLTCSRFPSLDRIIRECIVKDNIYEKYDNTKTLRYVPNWYLLKPTIEYILSQEEGKGVSAATVRSKIVRHISQKKAKDKKSKEQKLKDKRHACSLQRKTQVCQRRKMVLTAYWKYFVDKFGEGGDKLLHNDYTSDFESNDEDEVGVEGSSSQKRFFW